MRVIPRRGAHVTLRRVAIVTLLGQPVTDQYRKITMRCTMKLMHVAMPWATTNA